MSKAGLSRPARSVFAFAVYLLIVGPLLIAAPNFLLGLLGFPEAREPWIRILGAVATILGYYYLQAARHELTPFFRASIPGRLAFLVSCVAFAALRLAPPSLVLFGLIDAAGALWTATCLKQDRT